MIFILVDLQLLTEAIPEIQIEIPDLKYVLDFFATQFGSKDSSTDKKSSDEVRLVANKLLDIRAFKE